MQYELVSRTGQQPTLSIFGSFGAKVITTTHPYFTKVVEYLTTTPVEDHDEDALAVMLDPALRLGALLAEVSERVTYDSGAIYLDGVRLHSLIERHILERNEADDLSWDRLVRFLIKVDENPSRRAQEAIYQWIDQHGIQITEDGDFVGYKGVQANGRSVTAGPNNFINGVLFGTPGVACTVPHEVGDVISKKRADVDDNGAVACSTGLHVGTHEYATRFGARLLTVKINPRDVVSVPDNDLTYKIRVCRYEVIALNEAETRFSGYSYNEGDENATPTEVECPQCGGTGEGAETNAWEDFEDCQDCDGTGYVAAADPVSDGEDAEQGDLLAEVEDEDEGTDEEPETYREVPTLDPEDVPVEDDDTEAQEEVQEAPQEPSSSLTLAENAALVADLKRDLHDPKIGHKPLARTWSHLTTEASVRRYRKANGVSLTLRAKIKG